MQSPHDNGFHFNFLMLINHESAQTHLDIVKYKEHKELYQ